MTFHKTHSEVLNVHMQYKQIGKISQVFLSPMFIYRVRFIINVFIFSISNSLLLVVTQYYEAEVVSEYVIRGNTAVLKCNIPSFVSDFVRVEAWVGSDGSLYSYDSNYGN